MRDDVAAEIVEAGVVVQEIDQDFRIEKINSHRAEEWTLVVRRLMNLSSDSRILGFSRQNR